MNKLQAAQQFRRALQLFAFTLGEDRALEVPTLYPAWTPGQTYQAGDIVSHGVNSVGDPQLYQVAQAHTGQANWIPGQGTESLYTPMGLSQAGYPLWAQPSGAHDAYNAGDIVDYQGTLYQSTLDGNIWSPEAYPEGWQVYGG